MDVKKNFLTAQFEFGGNFENKLVCRYQNVTDTFLIDLSGVVNILGFIACGYYWNIHLLVRKQNYKVLHKEFGFNTGIRELSRNM